MSVCPTVSVLCFNGCYHPCLVYTSSCGLNDPCESLKNRELSSVGDLNKRNNKILSTKN